MNESTIAQNIITGIIAGVSAGVILAILVEAKRIFDFRMKRRRHIRQAVEMFRERILSAKAVPINDVPDGFPGELRGKELPLDMVRGACFGDMYREIVETLEGRSDTLTFDEKKEVRDAFGAYNLLLPGSDPFHPPVVPNEVGYHQIFDAFEAIKWLKVKSADRTSLGPKPPQS